MESFDGVAILASNLKANLDEAFARRLDAVIDFPLPDDESRLQLWDRCLGALAPRAGDLDLEFCAHAFELSGGNIRNCAILAASLASARDGAIEMADVIHAVRREYRKLGRICHQSEFGPYHDLVRT
jgi:SpoVK/Ycf46/Vps4 family AAA+-type ATPase